MRVVYKIRAIESVRHATWCYCEVHGTKLMASSCFAFCALRRWTSSHGQYCIKGEKECMKRVAGLGKMPIKEIA